MLTKKTNHALNLYENNLRILEATTLADVVGRQQEAAHAAGPTFRYAI
jgi:hypothetical protein